MKHIALLASRRKRVGQGSPTPWCRWRLPAVIAGIKPGTADPDCIPELIEEDRALPCRVSSRPTCQRDWHLDPGRQKHGATGHNSGPSAQAPRKACKRTGGNNIRASRTGPGGKAKLVRWRTPMRCSLAKERGRKAASLSSLAESLDLWARVKAREAPSISDL